MFAKAFVTNPDKMDQATTYDIINRWKEAHPSFRESILDGREKADAHVANSLYHKAKGGDTRAAEIWLRNRQSSRWRDKQVIEHEGGKTPIQVITGIEKGVGSEAENGNGSD